jgi:hypothetical protein
MGRTRSACGERRVAYRIQVEEDHLVDPGLDLRIILKWIFEKWDGGMY